MLAVHFPWFNPFAFMGEVRVSNEMIRISDKDLLGDTMTSGIGNLAHLICVSLFKVDVSC